MVFGLVALRAYCMCACACVLFSLPVSRPCRSHGADVYETLDSYSGFHFRTEKRFFSGSCTYVLVYSLLLLFTCEHYYMGGEGEGIVRVYRLAVGYSG